MVGLVIVSHSENLAKSVIELTSMMAPDAKIAAAGGLEDGSFGTSFERIQNAIEEVYSDEGVIILMDLGSAVMTAEMVIEMMEDRRIAMADCPLVEGAVVATVDAVGGKGFDEILQDLEAVWGMRKLSGN
ncbi:MAG: PTS-dependent dihydroxyacetone kinase phosphotransferase subunit DhaM [Lachnospiraceae bacterium]|nr:PTS-dependent dihydroxyacetone kinase phosphotransferase subunit DhaM [Lachnospiraceae bacterium]